MKLGTVKSANAVAIFDVIALRYDVRQAMRARHWSQSDLVDRLGFSKGALAFLRSDLKKPGADLLASLAATCDLDLNCYVMRRRMRS